MFQGTSCKLLVSLIGFACQSIVLIVLVIPLDVRSSMVALYEKINAKLHILHKTDALASWIRCDIKLMPSRIRSARQNTMTIIAHMKLTY